MYTVVILILALTSAVSSSQIVCRELADGFYADTSSGCVNFYRCVNGMQFKFTCAPGTKWSERLNTCDHAYNVQCEVARRSDERDYEPRSSYDPYVTEPVSNEFYEERTYPPAPSRGRSFEQPTTPSYSWQSQFSTTRPQVRRPTYSQTTTTTTTTLSPVYRPEGRSRELSVDESVDSDSSSSYWNQFSTTSPVIDLATGQVSTELITSEVSTIPTTTTTTEKTTTRRNLFTLRKRKPDPVASTTVESTTIADEVTSARSDETSGDAAMRNENWLVSGIPKVNVTTDTPVASSNDTAVSNATTPATVTQSSGNEDKSINRRVRMQSGSNSLIGTMMKWASKNIAKASKSNATSDNDRERNDEGKTLIKSPFDLEVELSTAKPLDPPATEVTNELAGDGELSEQSSMRPVYFPPSVDLHLTNGRSIYVTEKVKPLMKIVQGKNDETVNHPSPWSFPTGDNTLKVSPNAPNSRERRGGGGGDARYSGKNLNPPSSASAKLSGVTATVDDDGSSYVGVISEGRCICSKP